MSKFLKNVRDLDAFMTAVKQCKEDVWLIKNDKSEQFNLKSALSRYIALGKLLEEMGDQYEVFCSNAVDEGFLLKYFYEKDRETR